MQHQLLVIQAALGNESFRYHLLALLHSTCLYGHVAKCKNRNFTCHLAGYPCFLAGRNVMELQSDPGYSSRGVTQILQHNEFAFNDKLVTALQFTQL